MDFSFVEAKTLFLVVHLVGLALGVGGALISDAMFFKSIRDWRISKTEMGFLALGSWSVGIGLGLLILSGLGMFSLDPEKYLASAKFLAKMTIVAVLIVNAFILHNLQIPHLEHISRNDLSTRTAFAKNRTVFLLGGVVSVVSWLSALTLGAFRSVPWPYETILEVYLFALVFAFCGAFLIRDRLMPVHRKGN
jgi:hypothetical protein